jgi:hypothetical protein
VHLSTHLYNYICYICHIHDSCVYIFTCLWLPVYIHILFWSGRDILAVVIWNLEQSLKIEWISLDKGDKHSHPTSLDCWDLTAKWLYKPPMSASSFQLTSTVWSPKEYSLLHSCVHYSHYISIISKGSCLVRKEQLNIDLKLIIPLDIGISIECNGWKECNSRKRKMYY